MPTAPVVLLHSSGFSSRQWSRWKLPGRRRLAPELWHSGAHGAWPGPGPFRLRADVEPVLGLLAEHGPVDLVGHSYGGAVAVRAAAARPDLVRRLVAYEPPLLGLVGPVDPTLFPDRFLDRATAGDERWVEGFVDWWNGPGAWGKLSPSARRSFLQVGREMAGAVDDLVHDPRPVESYAGLPPTLLLVGEAAPEPMVRALERLAALPQVSLERVAGLGHMGPFLEPDRVEALTVAFLDR